VRTVSGSQVNAGIRFCNPYCGKRGSDESGEVIDVDKRYTGIRPDRPKRRQPGETISGVLKGMAELRQVLDRQNKEHKRLTEQLEAQISHEQKKYLDTDAQLTAVQGQLQEIRAQQVEDFNRATLLKIVLKELWDQVPWDIVHPDTRTRVETLLGEK
jgi:chromosome segregation ATPase